MKILKYNLEVEINGQYEEEASEGLKGAGEGLKLLEDSIRRMVINAANTTIKVTSLTKV